MRKTIFVSALLMLLGLTATAQENISVGEVLVPQGRQAMMEVKFHFNENHDYVSYQFTVNLPEGISLVTDGDGVIPVTLGDGQPASIYKGLDLNATSHILTCYSNPSTPIAATDGVLVRIPIEADASLTVGSVQEGMLKDVEFTKNAGSVRTPFANAAFTVKITDEIILDENSPIEPESTNGVEWNVRVKRTIKAGEWSTLCLPFDMTETQVKTVFGDDVQLVDFTEYEAEKEDNNVVGLTISFDEIDVSEGLYGNWPYLIKTSRDITEFTTTAAINPDIVIAEYDNGKTGRQRKVFGKFIGTYQANTLVPENSLFLSENKFYYSAGLTKMKAFRGYFDLNDVLAEVANAGARITLNIGDETTSIENVNWNGSDDRYYDLQGRQVEKPNKKGLYIHDGKKEIKK